MIILQKGKHEIKRNLTSWLVSLMLKSMILPTAFAVGDASASLKEGAEETTAEGEEDSAAKDVEASKNDKASEILTTTATSIPTSTAPKTACYPTAIDVRDESAKIRKIYDLSPGADPDGIPRADSKHTGRSEEHTSELQSH